MPSIQLKHDTSTNWTTYNPVLLEGEVGIETDTNKIKIGDGTTAYNSLDYFVGDIDLSDYYNKTQTDAKLAQKQDVLTPNAPLTIASYIRSNAHGFTFSDSSHIYSTSGSFREYYAPLGEYAGNFISCNTSSTDMWANSTFSTTQENFKSYIDIPLSKDKMITIPSDMALFIGYYNEDGVFLPISQLIETFSYTDGSGYYFYLTAGSNFLRVPQNKLTTTNTTNQPQVTTYSKFYLKDAGSSLTLQWQSVYDAQSTIRTTNIESTSILASRMTVARAVRRNDSAGYNSSNAIDVSTLGLYDYTGNFADFDPSELTNLFDISGQQAYNYLDLHIGTGLAVQNGNLVNTNSTAPAVMTGATSSTAGTSGLVPAPQAGDDTKFLSGDGTYKTAGSSVTVDQTYNASSTNAQSGTAVAEAISDCVQNDELTEVQVIVESSDILVLPSFYKVFSDGLCIQGGRCTSGTTVTFLKEFANTNYINTCSASASSTTGFTPSATGSYIVVGRVNLTTANS